jgi:hypothetical protein
MENVQNQTKIEDLTDLQLAEGAGQLYEQLLRIQSQLISVNNEIAKRKQNVKPAVNADAGTSVSN